MITTMKHRDRDVNILYAEHRAFIYYASRLIQFWNSYNVVRFVYLKNKV